VRRVLDLGCGPGVGTALLASAFPTATVVAVDGAAAMLARAQARAARLGLADRVEARTADLDGDLAALGPCDLAWAALAIHHVADEAATLARVRALLRPHGLVCLLERADPLEVRLADDLGRPGLWDRLRAAESARFERSRPSLPGGLHVDRHPGVLAAAGLEVLESGALRDTVTAPDDPATRAFLGAHLRRLVRGLAGIADPADLAALRARVEAAPAGWDGATVTSSRLLHLARHHSTRIRASS
jgi:SAM-dependent methyltransferase